MKRLLIIDGNALIHRAYHALPDFKRKDGTPTNAVYGFASVLHKIREDLVPSNIIVCFDTAAPTFRDELFPAYRSHRPKVDEDLVKQFPIVREFLKAAGIQYIEQDGIEADDVIAILTKQAVSHKLPVVILTGDKDIFQLVSKDVHILTPAIGFSKGVLYDPEKVKEKFGVNPQQIPDLKALMGDPSDNYKGVKGIGPKTAAELIRTYKSIENLYDRLDHIENARIRELLLAEKEHALLSKKLALLLTDYDGVQFDSTASTFSQYAGQLRDFFEFYQFNSLYRRFFQAQDSKAPNVSSKKDQNQLGLF